MTATGTPADAVAVKRWLPHIGIVAGLCLAIYALFFSSSDEDEIRALLEHLEDAVAVRKGNTNIVVRAAHVRKEFSERSRRVLTSRP